MSLVAHASLPRTGSWGRVAPLLLLAVGMCLFVLRATDWFRAVPGDLGDARFNSVILEHLHQWVRGEAPSLWSPAFFYPAHGTLAFSDNHFGSGPVYILFRFLGLSREIAFDAWFAFGCALNFIAMYFVMRRLHFAPFAASVAAFIFAFNLPAFLQASHAQLTYRFAIPMAYLAFLRFVEAPRVERLVPLAAWGALQFFCSIYLGVFLVYLLAATALAMLLPSLRPEAFRSPRAATGPAVSAKSRTSAILIIIACAAATGYLLFQYQSVSRSYGFARSPAEVITMLPRPMSYLVADRVDAYQWFGRLAQGIPARQEHQMFLGFVPLLLALSALLTIRNGGAAPRRRLLGISLVALAILAAVTLIVGDKSIYQLLMRLPGVSSVRAVSRVILVMALPVGIMAAIGVEALQKMAPSWLVAALVVVAASLETLAFSPIATPIDEWRSRTEPLAAAAATSPLGKDAVVYVTGRAREPDFQTELDGMVFAQDQKLPTLNGYSGNAPSGYRPPEPCTAPASRIQSMAGSIFGRSTLTPAALLSRTRWFALGSCPQQHPAVEFAASPPDEEQARHIQLDARVTKVNRDVLEVVVGIRNSGASALHTLSQVDHPLRLSWRFVPKGTADGSAAPSWEARQDLSISLPAGEAEAVHVAVRPPRGPGVYDLQFSMVAEGHAWLHDLGMPIAHLTFDSEAAHP
ncbi:hypothetical protein QTI17_15340 [Variovorax sp. J31P179]|uniref:hypothetical protein n=1 Tax=Variovorax sp. J31P179 TaxID=3053508 RepID=UPI002577C0DF|nr:hypothetical protein [Variovorax sp. J31P179]MDM0081969.1 hypothetical protein [Variovorax sp. J31P179]